MTLKGTLLEDGTTAPVPSGQTVTFTLGSGATAQTCVGTADPAGHVQCTIASVAQPDSATFTVAVTDVFAGDAHYLPSSGSGTAKLLYYTGRAYNIATSGSLLPHLDPVDTGEVTSAQAITNSPPPLAVLSGTINATVLKSSVVTGSGTSTAQTTAATLGINVPLVGLLSSNDVRTTSTSNCSGAAGQTSIAYLAIGSQVILPQGSNNPAPNTTLHVGLAKVVVNEQSAVPGADHGLVVDAVHVSVPGLADIVIGSSKSDIHNCP
jgi:hypothetical protein